MKVILLCLMVLIVSVLLGHTLHHKNIIVNTGSIVGSFSNEIIDSPDFLKEKKMVTKKDREKGILATLLEVIWGLISLSV
ncbi:MAG: hypothetical protein CM15mP83_7910 [Flavobacteriaceae bacterium]|nr:MAG: hypothetical protein CM15mP83_7910 [Flavobacteriaceae bacterium]